jgi:poly(3-hydroxybutyrate) depolymerase
VSASVHVGHDEEAKMRQLLFLTALLSGHTTGFAAVAAGPRSEDLTFQSGSITIACTLSLPAGHGPSPAVVLLSGSGAQNRDSEVLGFRPRMAGCGE